MHKDDRIRLATLYAKRRLREGVALDSAVSQAAAGYGLTPTKSLEMRRQLIAYLEERMLHA